MTAQHILVHPRTEHWLDEMDFQLGDWEDAQHEAFAAQQEDRWERDVLEDTRAWREEIEQETGHEFTDGDWLEFVADEMVAEAERRIDEAMDAGLQGLAHV